MTRVIEDIKAKYHGLLDRSLLHSIYISKECLHLS